MLEFSKGRIFARRPARCVYRCPQRYEIILTEKDVVVEAFTELAPRYEQVVDGELRRFWGWSYDGFVERLLELASVNLGETVLDVATGTAAIPRKLANRLESTGRIVGLDITLSMLRQGQEAIQSERSSACITLTCASATAMPYPEGTFDGVICGLATHHMDAGQMLTEMRRVLRMGGHLTIADVAASPSWKLPGIKTALRIATFLYFLPAEGVARAWAESDAVSHVYTAQEWSGKFAEYGFTEINITQLPSNHSWSPAPLVIRATKS